MVRYGLLFTSFTLSLLLCACGGSSPDPTPEPPTPTMSLSYHDLFLDAIPSAPVTDGLFGPPANAAPSDEAFEGRLELLNPGSAQVNALVDGPGVMGPGSVWRQLPPFSFDFVQDGAYLIPARQGLVYTGHEAWNYIVGPGRAWKQTDDEGYTRAAFPFALVAKNHNCIHNGVMTFLFSSRKTPTISRVRYQITQETCRYLKFNMWGQTAATYQPYSVTNAATVKANNAAELANRLPVKPLSALATDFPNSGVNPSGIVAEFQSRQDITFYGLFFNGVNYVSGCQTRYGEYAFCSEMRGPSYSVAKSAFNAVALMRLGQLYGSGVYNRLIRDYVPEYTRGGDWSTVTFDHGTDMATGNFLSSAYMSDEDGSQTSAFWEAVPYGDKIDLAFRSFPHKAAPGTTFVYQSMATFITNQAMNGYLRQQQGANADIFDLVRDDVYKPLHLSLGGQTILRTDNSDSGKAIGALGLYLISDDIAKIAKLLNGDNGVIDGKQVLDPLRLQESLFRNPASLGLPVPSSGNPPVLNANWHYGNGFWATRLNAATNPQYVCEFWVPYMSGWGGITVALFPNGATFYIFSDAGEYNWGRAAAEANKLSSFCR